MSDRCGLPLVDVGGLAACWHAPGVTVAELAESVCFFEEAISTVGACGDRRCADLLTHLLADVHERYVAACEEMLELIEIPDLPAGDG